MKQASPFDGQSLDPFSFLQNGLSPSEVDVGGRDVLWALVVATTVVLIDEGVDLLSEVAGQVEIFEQNAAVQSLMPAFGLALGPDAGWLRAEILNVAARAVSLGVADARTAQTQLDGCARHSHRPVRPARHFSLHPVRQWP